MKQKSSVNTDSIKVVFFDARDTLGEVDRPGHLVPYRPSTENCWPPQSAGIYRWALLRISLQI